MKSIIARILLKLLVGKNGAALVRRIVTWVGTLLVMMAAYVAGDNPVPIDPALLPEPDSGVVIHQPGEVGHLNGDMTVVDVLSAFLGMILVWGSRFLSWLRARNLDWLAEWIGPFIGRSLPQLIGAGLAVVSGILGYIGYTELGNTDLGNLPMTTLIGALISWMASAGLSAWEDGRRNPVETSPPKGLPAL